MTKLSPAAQAVLDATWREMDYAPRRELRWAAAAALRAAADQVVPEEGKECECFTNEAIRLNRMGVRAEFLAIADELEAQ
jgi:hypothetical protein